ncbi:MAG: hypothetical protein JO192_04120 [Candidatus Eremiobacteraeota bacterium]|nr:hypothetical protein [Candidatus Eremiobacteraeota bacterium]
MIRAAFFLVAFTCGICAVAGCKGLGDITGGGGTLPTPSGSPTATPTVAPCHTLNPGSNVVVVGISSQITASSTAPPFNSIAGYGLGNNAGTYSAQSTLIDRTSAGGPITDTNVVQFTNVEIGSSSTVNHSAVGFPGDAFPSSPYKFPSNAGSPTNDQIGSAFWSTGRIPPPTGSRLCFSQVFKLKRGSYFFGDLDFYNTATSYRDAIVVGTPGPDR